MNDHFWHLENGTAYPQVLKLYEYKNNSSEELWQEANESRHIAPQQPKWNIRLQTGTGQNQGQQCMCLEPVTDSSPK